jgi:ABC-type glycerol-3-phosphate transport system substrate-binding protein
MENSMKMIVMALAAATLTLSACGGTDSTPGNNTADVTNVTEVTNTTSGGGSSGGVTRTTTVKQSNQAATQ